MRPQNEEVIILSFNGLLPKLEPPPAKLLITPRREYPDIEYLIVPAMVLKMDCNLKQDAHV